MRLGGNGCKRVCNAVRGQETRRPVALRAGELALAA
jgi:hypothetical protein